MKFPFKTLERQLKEGGFERIDSIPVYEWQPETFPEYAMEDIGKRLDEWQNIRKTDVRYVFLRVRPMRDNERAGSSDHKKQKIIEVYVPK